MRLGAIDMSRSRSSLPAQSGLSLIELLLALALTALLGVMIASLINGWVDLRERTGQDSSADTQVLEFCLLLEQRFDALTARSLQEQRLALNNTPLVWLADRQRLEWVSRDAVAFDGLELDGVAPLSALRRQALQWDKSGQRLRLLSSGDIDAVASARWHEVRGLDGVGELRLQFYQASRWLAYPDSQGSAQGVRLEFRRSQVPYVCTFALPASG